TSNKFRKITPVAYEKARKKKTLEYYGDPKIGQEVCFSHYLDIVEPDRHSKKTPLNKIKQKNIEKEEQEKKLEDPSQEEDNDDNITKVKTEK
ncbi:26462_t:CDS:2, partial [Racocetra persica]